MVFWEVLTAVLLMIQAIQNVPQHHWISSSWCLEGSLLCRVMQLDPEDGGTILEIPRIACPLTVQHPRRITSTEVANLIIV